jgi:hypothetical protein
MRILGDTDAGADKDLADAERIRILLCSSAQGSTHRVFLEAGDGSEQFSATTRFVSGHTFSIGFKSAPQGGKSRSSTLFRSASHP